MGAQAVDYRVSKVVVCCKDCGQDVGLYPARHKCQDVVRPPLPPLPTKFNATTTTSSSHDDNLRVPRKPVPSYESENRSRPTSAASSTSSSTFNQHVTSDTSSATSTGSKWSRFVRSPSNNNMKNGNGGQGDNDDDSFYYNNFAAHLPETSSDSSSPQQSGKKLWGKVRQNEKWKQLNEKYDKPKQSAKLWGKLVQATQNMADKIPSRDDRGPESDESDWEGESHVSRVLREYYEKKHEPLPRWLYDERAPRQQPQKMTKNNSRSYENDDSMLPPLDHSRQARASGRKQKLWEANPEPQLSQREREREELRQQRRAPLAENNNAYAAAADDRQSRRAAHPPPPMDPSSAYDERSTYRRGGNHMDHDPYDDRAPSARSATYRRPERQENEGWKMSSRSNTTAAAGGGGGRYGHVERQPPPTTTASRPAHHGYDHDDYSSASSRNYLSDRRAGPPPSSARARSPGRYNDDISPSTSSDYYGSRYGSPPQERVRGPRDIPNQFSSSSRYAERGGGYF